MDLATFKEKAETVSQYEMPEGVIDYYPTLDEMEYLLTTNLQEYKEFILFLAVQERNDFTEEQLEVKKMLGQLAASLYRVGR